MTKIIRNTYKNCSYSFGVKKIEPEKWGFVGNFIVHIHEKPGVRATHIPPEGVGLIEKYVKTEDEAVALAKRTIERYIDKHCSN